MPELLGLNPLLVIAVVYMAQYVLASKSGGEKPPLGRPVWRPNGNGRMSRDDHLEYAGRTRDDYLEDIRLMKQLKARLIAQVRQKQGTHGLSSDYSESIDDSGQSIDDIIYNRHQILAMLRATNRRYKRKIIPFSMFPTSKWTMPIKYKVDSMYTADEEAVIDRAVAEWQAKTCIRFAKISLTTALSTQHLLITSRTNKGCQSYLGHNPVAVVAPPQPLFLEQGGCTSVVGIAIHELGHAVGLYHEQTRRDRDLYVDIIWNAIITGGAPQFTMIEDGLVETRGVAYDLGSVMHYGPTAFSRVSAKPTIIAKEESLNSVMGQRSELSFYDAYIINQAYCPACTTALPCQNGGYTDPLDCNVCRCPDGFGGTLCDQVESGSAGCLPLSGLKVLDISNPTVEGCLESPNHTYTDTNSYVKYGSYRDLDSCSWKLKAPAGCTIDIWFDAQWFGMAATYPAQSCLHWVEVQHKTAHKIRGQRFCGYGSPAYKKNKRLTSETSEVFVLFRSPEYSSNERAWYYRRGFKLCYRLTDPSCIPSTTTNSPTTPTKPTTPTTPVKTTRTKPTPAKTTPTKPTTPVKTAPTTPTPVKTTPTKPTPAKTTPTKPTPAKTTRTKPTPAKTTPTKPTPAKTTRTKPTPAKTTPTKPTPAKTTPTKPTPAKTTPTKPTPAKTTPTKPTPAKTTPTKPTPAKTTPTKPTPAKTTPTKPTPAKTTPTKPTPVKTTPTKPTPAKTTPTKPTPAKTTPTKPTPAKTTPTKPTPAKTTPTKPTPAKTTPTTPTPAKTTPTKPTPAKTTPTKLTTPKKPTTKLQSTTSVVTTQVASTTVPATQPLTTTVSTTTKPITTSQPTSTTLGPVDTALCVKLDDVLCQRLQGVGLEMLRINWRLRVTVVRWVVRLPSNVDNTIKTITADQIKANIECMIDRMLCTYKIIRFKVGGIRYWLLPDRLIVYFIVNIQIDPSLMSDMGTNPGPSTPTNDDDVIKNAIKNSDWETMEIEIVYNREEKEIQETIPSDLLPNDIAGSLISSPDMSVNGLTFFPILVVGVVVGVLCISVFLIVLVYLNRSGKLCWTKKSKPVNEPEVFEKRYSLTPSVTSAGNTVPNTAQSFPFGGPAMLFKTVRSNSQQPLPSHMGGFGEENA